MALTADSATLDQGDNGKLLTVPVTRLEIHTGSASHAGTGALIGGLAAFAGSYVFFTGFCRGMGGASCDSEVILPAFVSGTLGAGLGAFIGLLARTDRWEEVPLSRAQVTPVVVPDGRFGLAASLKF